MSNETNYIRLDESDCRNVASSLAPEYGSIVSTGEILTRTYEIYDDVFEGELDELHQDSIDRIYWLVQHASVTVTFPDQRHPGISEVLVYSGEFDGKPVIEIVTTDEAGTMADGNPDIRVHVNDGLVYGDEQVYPENEG